MSDLDDLAAANGAGPRPRPVSPASRGAASPQPPRPDRPTASSPQLQGGARPSAPIPAQLAPSTPRPESAAPPAKVEVLVPIDAELPPGVNPQVWVWLSVSVVVVLGLAFWLINRDPRPTDTSAPLAGSGATSSAPQAGVSPPAAPDSDAPPSASSPDGVAPTTPDGGPATRVQTPSRPSALVLEDIQDPAAAIDAYVVKRTEPDKVEVKVRNKSKRGVYVRSLEIFAESDDRVPLDSIRFWLPPGGGVGTVRTIEDMPRRLGDDEGVTVVVQDAEFSDTEPKGLETGTEDEPPPEASDETDLPAMDDPQSEDESRP